MWTRHAFVVVILFAWFSDVAVGDSPAKAIERIMHQPRFQQCHWGALFVDQDSGQVIYKSNDDKLFGPASTAKLFSVACALDVLGADYRFLTPVVRRGDVNSQGELEGDLILIASGDLSFGGRTNDDGTIAFTNVDHTYANDNSEAQLIEHDPLAGLNDLAKQVSAAGIKRVRGDVLVDDRIFDRTDSSGSGPSRTSPCMINDNVIDFVFTPTEVGHLVNWTSRPTTSAIQIESKVVTAKQGKPLQVSFQESGSRLTVTGQIPQGHKPALRIHEVRDPTAFARSLFIEALHRAGVAIDSAKGEERPTSSLPAPAEAQTLPQVAVMKSPPFSESVKLILKVSHNLHASTLPLLVAHQSGERTLNAGLKRQHDFLRTAKVDVDLISFGGGAGGSRADLVTPRGTVQLLRFMAKRPDFSTYRDALPRLGVDGTLATNIAQDSPVRDKVQAKTGTMYYDNTMNGTRVLTSKALAGYMTNAKGRKIVFAIFVNNAHLHGEIGPKTFGDDLARVCEAVYLSE